jgi:hypothetical protein
VVWASRDAHRQDRVQTRKRNKNRRHPCRSHVLSVPNRNLCDERGAKLAKLRAVLTAGVSHARCPCLRAQPAVPCGSLGHHLSDLPCPIPTRRFQGVVESPHFRRLRRSLENHIGVGSGTV